ncbi:hypothetical protein Clacol_008753 [Clathrus columnatus]|uniref:Uncharacterized protein n=1 Tax=Clathrus columnatus TaxID=1419009 RepID=A0AAV5AIN4_9AGAM|nr:hypothetical protein Clacol_008753 [Clathrus columnatus]
MGGIISPPLLTVRQDSGSTSTTTKADVHQPFTFYSASSPKGAIYKLTTHLYPSAYPRSPYKFSSIPVGITEYERISAEKKKDVREKMVTDYMAVLEEWVNGVNYGLEDDCENLENYESICAAQNEIVRNDPESNATDLNRERLTLFLAHASGSPKERNQIPNITPMIAPSIVEEIWVFEAAQHGDTGLINVGLLPRAYDWLDNVRDILQFLFYYIPDRMERAANGEPIVLPTYLTRLPEITATVEKMKDITHGPWARVAIEYCSLSSSPFLADPITQPVQPDSEPWNPDVLATYIEYGIVEEAGITKLKMSGLHEAILSFHVSTWGELWQLFPQLDSHLPLLFVKSGLDQLAMGNIDAVRQTVWRRPDNASNVVLPIGHFVSTMEKPDTLRIGRRTLILNIIFPQQIPHEAPVELANLIYRDIASLIKRFLIEKHSSNMNFDAPERDANMKMEVKSML